MKHLKILILGATGMLGHALFRRLSELEDLDAYATARSTEGLGQWFAPERLTKIMGTANANDFDSIIGILTKVKPDVVINCIGIIKQLPEANDPITSITINSLFPHRLAKSCGALGARMIHFSTDCVFSGAKGKYKEEDFADADNLYGRTKYLGEVYYPHCITVRTSILGHELTGKHGLLEWFLGQEGKVRGFVNAVFSGLTTVEIARILSEYVLPNKDLNGLYHVSSGPISKYNLLKLIAEQYGKKIEIEPQEDFRCDRSLDSSRFQQITGYAPPSWEEMIAKMYAVQGRRN